MRIEQRSLRTKTPSQIKAWTSGILRRASHVLRLPKAAEVSVVFLQAGEMRELNRRFRGQPKATTTLSFGQGPVRSRQRRGSEEMVQEPQLLGEMFLCLGEIRRFGQQSGLSLRLAVEYLALHSLLHLLGYHHRTARARASMEKISKRITQF